mmetsp:Transcript_134037/g.199368  ORF Transcript_134037/g.199368 Transcript_134037/m.199368 type:complete len:483 (-) Transcript_134037:521-1969(-)|eukprot:CAMPEP_0117015196 /NCGR_PEP_ID=MMETSP0472-20121206/12186_1 /TAXON_ID=693140 ORGANISM="Tiarina fusus, Strain LIS" /NCGR_SAMPLE_ID=MMETSP0472 /ASSEMBLY_ACC=CAM_ASM_000603 /LENGTH=482 /DNA_ID=CAMNT_0004718943 /DNA_START=347 /DNA_END=1795 /DNA_ORIENTATION=-
MEKRSPLEPQKIEAPRSPTNASSRNDHRQKHRIGVQPHDDEESETCSISESADLPSSGPHGSRLSKNEDDRTKKKTHNDPAVNAAVEEKMDLKPAGKVKVQGTVRKSSLVGNSNSKTIAGRGERLLPDYFKPSTYSVIIGRGKESKDHSSGNKRLKVLVSNLLPEYANAVNRKSMSRIVSAVVSKVREACSQAQSETIKEGRPIGSFVRLGKEDGRWYEVSDAVAREKVGYTFRDMLGERYRSSSKYKVARKRKLRAEEEDDHQQERKTEDRGETIDSRAASAVAAAPDELKKSVDCEDDISSHQWTTSLSPHIIPPPGFILLEGTNAPRDFFSTSSSGTSTSGGSTITGQHDKSSPIRARRYGGGVPMPRPPATTVVGGQQQKECQIEKRKIPLATATTKQETNYEALFSSPSFDEDAGGGGVKEESEIDPTPNTTTVYSTSSNGLVLDNNAISDTGRRPDADTDGAGTIPKDEDGDCRQS